MSQYVIREVDGDEHEQEIRELHDETFGDEAPNVDASADGYWWIAYLGREPVAFAGLVPSLRYPDVGYLKRTGVSLHHRGKGLQRRLIRARETKARRLGWTHLVTDTSDNPESANNLIKSGYRIYEPEWPYAFRHTIYWRKFLNVTEYGRRSKKHRDSGRAAEVPGTDADGPYSTPERYADRLREPVAAVQDQRAEDAGVQPSDAGGTGEDRAADAAVCCGAAARLTGDPGAACCCTVRPCAYEAEDVRR